LSWPIAELYHPLRRDTKRIINIIGITQYIAVGSYILFFGSYTIDLFNIKTRDQQLQRAKKEDNRRSSRAIKTTTTTLTTATSTTSTTTSSSSSPPSNDLSSSSSDYHVKGD
jgi:hypothetical protein